ncbi:MAG: LysR substrate-binding domain-containing protein [Paracoccus sp. (in: a-proteobacteria)]|uniref:LysR family transcriptional regulator n=1 Tax=Paracoccus sp. TaxID=267 RepID=UPI0039E71BCF
MAERFTLAQLRCFVAVAETLNFRQAAADLNMTQPPLTRQIQALERAVGAPLLDRSGKRVELTPAGHVLLEDAMRILGDIAHIRTRVREAAATGHRTLAVSYLDSCEPDVLPTALNLFRQRQPDVHVHLEVHSSFEAEDRLLGGNVDVAFLRPPVRSAEVDLTLIRKESLVAVLPVDHPLAGRPIGLIELKDEEFIGFSPTMDASIRSAMMHACVAAGFIPHYTHKTTSIPMLMSMIAEGVGISLLSSASARVRRANVVYSPIRDRWATAVLACGVLRERTTPQALAFIEAAREAAQGLPMVDEPDEAERPG